MRTLALAHTRAAAVKPSAISLPQIGQAKQNEAHEGVLVFCGISLALAALSVVFSALNLPSAFLF